MHKFDEKLSWIPFLSDNNHIEKTFEVNNVLVAELGQRLWTRKSLFPKEFKIYFSMIWIMFSTLSIIEIFYKYPLYYFWIYNMMPISYLEGEYGGGGWCWRVLTGNPGMTTVCSTPKIGSTPPPIDVETAPVKCVCWTVPLIFEGDPRPLPWQFPSMPNDSSLKLKD